MPSPTSSPLDLVTLAQVQNWLIQQGSMINANEPQMIQDAITAFSVFVLRQTGRGPQDGSQPDVLNGQSPFVTPVSYFEIRDGNGNSKLPLRNWPIVSVQGVTFGGIAVPASTGPLGAAVVAFAGTGYAANNVIPVPGGTGGTITVDAVSVAGAVTQSHVTAVGSGYTTTGKVALSGGSGTGLVVNVVATPQTQGYVVTGDGKFLALLGGNSSVVATFSNLGQFWGRGGGYGGASNPGWPLGVQNITVSYTAGFAAIPVDLSMMARKYAARCYKQRASLGEKSKAAPQGAGTMTYDWGMSDEDMQTLMFYQRRSATP
jgi:hypothetical protein